MKLRLKYGFKMLFRDPVRVAASFLAAIVALGIAGMCIFMQTYNIFPWGKELFFNYSFVYNESWFNEYLDIHRKWGL